MVLESINTTGAGTPLADGTPSNILIVIGVGTLDPANQITRIVRFGQNYTRRTRCLEGLLAL